MCPNCENSFTVKRSQYLTRTSKNKSGLAFCSMNCHHSFHGKTFKDGKKRCPACNIIKSESEYQPSKINSRCRECSLSADKDTYRKRKRDPEVDKRYKTNYRNRSLMRNYGLSIDDYDKILASQNFKCAICKIKGSDIKYGKEIFLSVDHCHETGKVRGLLCFDCNVTIGKAKDSIPILISAIEYLSKSYEP